MLEAGEVRKGLIARELLGRTHVLSVRRRAMRL
jgi:hypothetical protein